MVEGKQLNAGMYYTVSAGDGPQPRERRITGLGRDFGFAEATFG